MRSQLTQDTGGVLVKGEDVSSALKMFFIYRMSLYNWLTRVDQRCILVSNSRPTRRNDN